jgi:hypothetical protein
MKSASSQKVRALNALMRAKTPASRERALRALDRLNARKNSGGRKLTKKQRKAKAARTAKKRGLAKAASALMKKINPAVVRTSSGFRTKRLKGGGVSIIPLKIRRVRR